MIFYHIFAADLDYYMSNFVFVLFISQRFEKCCYLISNEDKNFRC